MRKIMVGCLLAVLLGGLLIPAAATGKSPKYTYYSDGTLMPHILGRVGLISAEEYKEKKEAGEPYALNAIIGKEGIESAMESYLKGTIGVKTISTDADGVVTTEFSVDPQQGDTVVLTIDKNLQNVAKDALSTGLDMTTYNWYEAVISALIIAIVTFIICMTGIFIGKKAGTKLAGKASILGGVILIAIGLKIFISGVFF